MADKITAGHVHMSGCTGCLVAVADNYGGLEEEVAGGQHEVPLRQVVRHEKEHERLHERLDCFAGLATQLYLSARWRE